jgi:hypothetical protein
MSVHKVTSSAMRVLFEGLIDYAGLYPPAALGLSESVANYRSYVHGNDNWMVARFICGTVHAAQFTDELQVGFHAGSPLDVSLVTRDPVQDVPRILAELPASVRIGAVEVALTSGKSAGEQIASHREFFNRLTDRGRDVSIFYELSLSEAWDEEFLRLADALGGEVPTHSERTIGCKLRCGGLEAHLIPSPERLGSALYACADRSIPVKFTAGLHQPFRHKPHAGETGSVGVPMHGYFNLYWAAMAANLKALRADEVVAIVAEMDSCSPAVESDSVEWLGIRLSSEEIRNVRSSKVLSFGSCSFDEPVSAARQLGWV